MTTQSQAQLYLDHLRSAGFVPDLVGEAEVRFKVEGGLYQILVDAKEPIFFRMIFPRFRQVRDGERARAEAAANHASAGTKVAKVYINDDYLSAAVELFCSPPESFKPVFERSLKVLQHAVKECKQHLAT